MEKYIGVKIIKAEPSVRIGSINYIKTDAMPRSMEKHEEGYRVTYPDGYVSWSPKAVFEEAYRRIDNMTFGLAVEAMKKGNKVQRKGWNGKGMFIFIQKGSIVPAASMKPSAARHLFGNTLPEYDATVEIKPHIDMKATDGTLTIGWCPSQVDMLSEDWQIVDEA